MTPDEAQVWLHHVPDVQTKLRPRGRPSACLVQEPYVEFYDVTINHKPNRDRMNTSHLILKSKRKLYGAVTASLLIGISQTHATQTVRELFDKIGNSDYITINGLGSGPSSYGLQGTWAVSPQGLIDGTNATSTAIVYKDTWSLDWPLGSTGNNLLGHSAGQNGLLNFNAGANLNTLLTDPDTGLPYGNFTSKSYATRPLALGSQINCQADGTYYFSVRIVKSYSWWVGDNSEGFGVATGGGTNAHFVGFGVTRPSCLLADNTTEIGSAAYVTTGTLGQAGISSHPEDTSGPYLPLAWGAANQWVGWDWTRAGLLVGKLTTTASGACTLQVKSYISDAALDTDSNLITWDASYNFTETNVMTHLLVFMHGTGAVEYDAIRIGTTYGDVVGFELIGAPKGSPANTVFAGTTVTISQNAGINTGTVPMSYQWRSNGVDIVDATNATLVLTDPTTAFTANYSVTLSNLYGGPVTSPETLITINPAVPPYYVQQPNPVSLTRYAGAPSAQFSVTVNGTPPFTYQWKHAGTNYGAPVTTANTTDTLSLSSITAAQGGSYTVTVTNGFGSTNSATATLNVLAPSSDSYAAAVLNLPTNPTNLFGYWRMDDAFTTNNPALQNYWNGQNGQVSAMDLDAGKIVAGVEGATYPAFPAPHLAAQLGARGDLWALPYRVDLYNLPSAQTNMTFTMWVKGGVRLAARSGYGQAYGLENQGGNAIRFYWGAYNSTNGVRTAQWDTGLNAPQNEWTFVALVVNGNSAAVYVGSKTSFTSASTTDIGGIPDLENGGLMTLVDSTTVGDSNLRLGVGRTPVPWADDGNGAPWTSSGGTWSDIAVLYQALTPTQAKRLFLVGAGLQLEGTPDGGGNLNLNWLSGFTLQEAPSVTGPWTDIGAATPPYSVPITTIGNKFYRVKPTTF